METEQITSQRRKVERRNILAIFGMVIVCLAMASAELCAGASDLNVFTSLQALFGIGTPGDVNTVQSIRLPRVATACVTGAGLALAGAALQSVLENPLASASTVGISQGAAFGATLAILIVIPAVAGSASNAGMGVIALCAFAGAMTSSLVVLLFSRLGIASPESIILVGVALSALWAGASTILQYFSNDLNLTKVIFWQFGDLGRATWEQICLMFVVGGACSIYFFLNRWNYNALQNGGNVAGGLGVDVRRTRLVGVFVSSLMAAIMVSFVGLINFIGLIAPHIARRIIGNDYRFLLPASLVLGAFIMLASDFVSRTVISPIILPIGAITSFLGAPLFLYLLYRGYKR
ncbi:FecCD family ABC transporter permease [Curtanaerobium respiraculi]|uniref:FecCD family ABC transporter permease n=1 Tax=Curtanaerobium respiraculi TaxID=2949669 RepID=UPI0024B3BB7C|nr:iron ABC transporter permease [Curtanaerobium respiraculi]